MIQKNNAMNFEENQPSKPFWEMTVEERDALAQKAIDDAKERMHQNGVAYVEIVDGKQHLRHPDGSLTPIEESES
ncbi:MAG: hypothetical protein AAF378_00105 [Cyanobacteria bacterium P01_A01_bin.84]